MKEILQFLEELDANNQRDWFEANRGRYEKTRKQFLDLTASLILEIRKFDSEVPLQEPRDCMFRKWSFTDSLYEYNKSKCNNKFCFL